MFIHIYFFLDKGSRPAIKKNTALHMWKREFDKHSDDAFIVFNKNDLICAYYKYEATLNSMSGHNHNCYKGTMSTYRRGQVNVTNKYRGTVKFKFWFLLYTFCIKLSYSNFFLSLFFNFYPAEFNRDLNKILNIYYFEGNEQNYFFHKMTLEKK